MNIRMYILQKQNFSVSHFGWIFDDCFVNPQKKCFLILGKAEIIFCCIVSLCECEFAFDMCLQPASNEEITMHCMIILTPLSATRTISCQLKSVGSCDKMSWRLILILTTAKMLFSLCHCQTQIRCLLYSSSCCSEGESIYLSKSKVKLIQKYNFHLSNTFCTKDQIQ